MEWQSKDGRRTEICDMETSHLKNTVAMLNRRGAVSISDRESMLCCSPPNGDMASYYFDQEFDTIFSSPVCRELDELRAELKKRKS